MECRRPATKGGESISTEKYSTNLDYARQLIGAGYKVFPTCWPTPEGTCACPGRHQDPKEIGKAPLYDKDLGLEHAHLNASSKVADAFNWWKKYPNANIAIALDGLLMIDPDDDNAQAEVARWELPPTVVRYSRQNALIYRVPQDFPRTRMTKKGDSKEIDLLSNGYCMVGGTHLEQMSLSLDSLDEPAMAPESLLERFKALMPPERPAPPVDLDMSGNPPVRLTGEGLEWWTGAKTHIGGNGQIDRSTTLFRMASFLHYAGATEPTIAAALQERDAELYGKYTDRRDAPIRYTEIALRVCQGEIPHIPEDPGETVYAPLTAKPSSNGSRPHLPEAWPPPIKQDAFYGLAGEIVERIAPQTEGDPVALLLNTLICFGSAAGRATFARVENSIHPMIENVGITGATSKGRKGTAWDHSRDLFDRVDPVWTKRIASGLSSGEGLVYNVRDPIEKEVKDKDGNTTIQIVDEGVRDKRLLVVETEFASVLKMIVREGNTLSPILRQAWDSGGLRVLTKNSPAQASGAHVSIMGHITKEELLRHITETDLANGLANRFLWVLVKRSKILPRGGERPEWGEIVPKLRAALEWARRPKEISRDEEAEAAWADIYEELSEGQPGLLGAVTNRAEAHVLRLSLFYAAMDMSPTVQMPHLMAGLALWEYAAASAQCIFGDKLGDPEADRILSAIASTPEQYMDKTGIGRVFSGHMPRPKLEKLIELLLNTGRVWRDEIQTTGGRPREIFRVK